MEKIDLLPSVEPHTKSISPFQVRVLLSRSYKFGPGISLWVMNQLTDREQNVMNLICQGKSNAEIARQLELSVNTVKTHLRHVFKKLGVDNRTAATVRFLNLTR